MSCNMSDKLCAVVNVKADCLPSNWAACSYSLIIEQTRCQQQLTRWQVSQVMSDDLQYIEEPVQDTRDLAAFFGQTHIPMALDETLDEAFSGQGLFRYNSALGPEQRLQQQLAELGHGAVVALVAKPGMIGGFERAMSLSYWAASQGIKVFAQWLHCHM